MQKFIMSVLMLSVLFCFTSCGDKGGGSERFERLPPRQQLSSGEKTELKNMYDLLEIEGRIKDDNGIVICFEGGRFYCQMIEGSSKQKKYNSPTGDITDSAIYAIRFLALCEYQQAVCLKSRRAQAEEVKLKFHKTDKEFREEFERLGIHGGIDSCEKFVLYSIRSSEPNVSPLYHLPVIMYDFGSRKYFGTFSALSFITNFVDEGAYYLKCNDDGVYCINGKVPWD